MVCRQLRSTATSWDATQLPPNVMVHTGTFCRSSLALRAGWLTFALVLSLLVGFVEAATPVDAERLFFAGQYEACLQMSRQEMQRGVWNERWSQWVVRCLLTLGRYSDARETYESALDRFGNRIRLRFMGHEVYRYVDRPDLAEGEWEQIHRLVRSRPWRFSSAQDQVTLGRLFAMQGEDSRKILELVYDRVRDRSPQEPAVYIAIAELALDKQDAALAIENLETAAKLAPENPQIAYLQALAWRDSEPSRATEALARALKLNPRHIPSLLLQVDQLIDAERYAEAVDVIEQVLQINLYEPKAWAYHAVLAHLQGHFQGELRLRNAALATWSTNYEIDHLIGRKLSQKYRFAEGAQYQRRSLRLRPDYAPAQFQLAQDLLRLGQDDEGWRLAADVQSRDGYHVVAYNLMTLKDQLDRFRTLTTDGLEVRMEAREADIYGPRVLQLLQDARQVLCEKYEVELDGIVDVEIFPRQQDFAIRTFGLPGGAGYLGVCFGRLITANSPAAQGANPSNWQAVLWHEFCHVVTLQKTNNRMPRWLSEGISVYEERQRNPAWGQRMTPDYRQMITDGQLTPVSQLSGAFLRPSSPQHLQFAYYESSLVVEFLIERYGLDLLRRVLVDLSVGMPIEQSLERYIGPPAVVDQQFAEFACQQAEALAPQLQWRRDILPETATASELAALLEQHPNNYWLMQRLAQAWIDADQWQQARELLESLYAIFPTDTSPNNAARQLARVYRRMEDRDAERRVLAALAELDGDATDVYLRLMELAAEQEQWETLRREALRLLAVNPLIPSGHEMLALAGERLQRFDEVIGTQQAMLQMDPADPARIHYRLACAFKELGQTTEARRQILMALEHAPRYRAAQQLLLDLIETDVTH